MAGIFSTFLFSFLLVFAAPAHADFAVPALSGPVMDEVGVLRQQDRYDLENVIRDYNAQGKAQLQVLIIDSLQGLTIEEAAIKIADKWKLGTAKKDNGILFLIAPQEKKIRIEVGQGLEGALPDVIAKRIIADTVLPLFKSNNLSAGVVVGIYQIIKYIDQEYADQHLTAEPTAPVSQRRGLPGWMILVIILVLLFIGRLGGGGRRGFYGGGFGGFGGGGFGGGGGGGGGWSGGGGGFSGGGASGSW